uniref:hypothetical protein n=1 Tax=Petrachloros mirabilis TaxID=2918835 RepID=UPI001EE93AEF|nr:hypothetical protein [Petrachloros mirabilis]
MAFDLQILIAILTALLVFATGIFLRYDQIQLRQYTLSIPQWVSLSVAAVTFFLVAVDQVLRGLVRLEEIQRRNEEAQRRSEEAARRVAQERAEARRRSRETARRVAQEQSEANRRAEEAERTARRARVEARYRIAQIRYQLDPIPTHRQELEAVLAFLEEYGETL